MAEAYISTARYWHDRERVLGWRPDADDVDVLEDRIADLEARLADIEATK